VKSRGALLALACLFVVAVYVLRRGHPEPSVVASPAPVELDPRPAPPPAPLPSTAPPPVARANRPAVSGPSESSLMSELRGIGASDPARALSLAREANRRFPNSVDAAERSWTICKSLAALGRGAEARDEAQRMVERYPGTEWANDVRRHLLTQPLEDPGQRGYGKASELH